MRIDVDARRRKGRWLLAAGLAVTAVCAAGVVLIALDLLPEVD